MRITHLLDLTPRQDLPAVVSALEICHQSLIQTASYPVFARFLLDIHLHGISSHKRATRFRMALLSF
jgi:hypothetical protein